MIRVEPEIGHLAHPDAVEKDGGAGEKAGNSIVEPHLIAGALAEPARRFEPIDKGEACHDGCQREETDQNVARLDFHWT